MTKTAPVFIQFSFYTFFLFFLFFTHANSQLIDQEQTVLLKLKQHWQNPPALSHWNPLNSSHYCNWPEITCTNGSLTQLRLPNKNITGTFPPFICDLKNLTLFDLSNNNIFNEFPKALYNCSKLEDLDLSQNYFNGPIPLDIHRLSRLRRLNLGANSFSGNIPTSIGQLKELRKLQLFSCPFSGSFPLEIGNLYNLERLELAYNVNMTAAVLPSSFTKLKKLTYLWMAGSNLNGEIPDAIGEMEALVHLDLSRNNLSGKIPSSLFMPKNLSIVYLYKNQLSGEIPRVVKALNIDVIDLSENKLTGTIPDDFGRLRNMSATIYRGLCLQTFGRYSRLEDFQVSANKLTGNLPEHLCGYGRMVGVVAFDNDLTGELPKSLGNCSGLRMVSVYNNRFTGNIPSGLWTSSSLSFLMISNNSFMGELPQSVAANLSRLQMSNNNFSGKIPTGVSFLEEFGGLVMAVVVGLLATCLVIRIYKKTKQVLDSTWRLTSFHRLNFTESEILSGLTENNLIGSGGSGKVYRVVVNHSHDTVAVKRIWNSQKLEEKLEKEFLAEVKILSSIRHSNIVKLLCCIFNDNTKLLVYEYSKNHSLDQWLHTRSRASNVSGSIHPDILDWPKRLQIAIGAAQGLHYMHNDCVPPIVHRDVKSSNILLDSEFNAKIADFGLAKMLINKREGEFTTMSTVAGSFGYIAPEYAHTTRVNEKIDVYSFGVILLELTTGRKANDGDEHTSLAQWAWRHIQEGNPIVDALDEAVKEPDYLDEMSCVFNLGIICTNTQPLKRPSMKEVLQILLKCSQPLIYGGKNTASLYDASPLLKNSKRDNVSENDDEILESIV
uniref:Protein kinase domain-containing protein n=1 Tax=Fagus sylvatica TaxID=28930 RepID=A0A2N9G6Y9_FAGSY